MRFFLQLNGQTEGPFTVEEIEDLHGSGRVNRSTPCRPDGKGDWSSIYNLVPTAIWVTSPRNKPAQMKCDPPDRSGLPKKILWIGLFCVIALALVIPIFGIVAEEIASKDRITRLQAPAPPLLAADPLRPNALQNSLNELHKPFEEFQREMKRLEDRQFYVTITFLVVSVPLFAFWLWMLITVVTTEPEGSDKIVWTLVVVFTGPIGAAIYFFARHTKRGSNVYAR